MSRPVGAESDQTDHGIGISIHACRYAFEIEKLDIDQVMEHGKLSSIARAGRSGRGRGLAPN